MRINSNIRGMVVPHTPTLLVDELDKKDSSIINALRHSGAKLKKWGVEVVVAASTHWQTDQQFAVDNSPTHATVTDYYGFRREIQYDAIGHPALADMLLSEGRKNLIYPIQGKRGVDHAITIPLHFMFPERDVRVIPISIAGTPLCAFRWGRTIGHTLQNWNGKVLFMVSGSLAHDLACFSRGIMVPEHEIFDREVLRLLSEGKGMDVLAMDRELIQIAKPEGAFRDLIMLLGVVGSRACGKVSAYEKLPGVGSGVIEFYDTGYTDVDEEALMYFPHGAGLH